MGDYASLVLTMVSLIGALSATVYAGKYIADIFDPSKRKTMEASKYVKRLLRILGKENIRLTEHEIQLACSLVNPADVTITWDDIGGLNEVAESLREAVVWPLRHRKIFGTSSMLQAPKGILLHGPPGCGKTMLAKAVAAESGLCFLNVQASSLLSMWQGETENLTAAVFSLANKLAPTIIFIDEIDLLLGTRGSSANETTGSMKGQFMALCDGLLTDRSSQVVLLGATNRRDAIDPAILRRLPLQFPINLPTTAQRAAVLRVLLRNERVAPDLDIDLLAKVTVGKSGSDLREMCRSASMVLVRELVSRQRAQQLADNDSFSQVEPTSEDLRPLSMADFRKVCPEYFADTADIVD